MTNLFSETQLVAGRLCLDFLNTQIRKRGQEIDFLSSSRHLADWLEFAGVLPSTEAKRYQEAWSQGSAGEQALEKALAFRSALCEVVESVLKKELLAPSAFVQLNAVLRTAPTYPQLHLEDNHFNKSVQSARTDDQWFVALTEDAADFLSRSDLSLLKQCEGATCIRVFYDTTKNHKRRWCSVEKCGSRAKAAAYYRRSRNRESVSDVSGPPK